ncbi:MAG: InlB B-repeat-containing protein [bacterium]|nr:InlB B-repeat-containing protein [bacterium]
MKKKILQINAIIFFIIFAIVVISMNIDINKIATNTILNSDMLIELNNNEYQYDINSNKIGTILNFNTSNKGLDSEPDYSRSTLEFNKNEDFDILISNLFEASELSKLKNKYCYKQDSSKCNIHIAQPRIIKTKSGKYILVFYTTTDYIYLKYNNDKVSLLNNGLDVYYTISDDLKHWTTPKLLFECNYKEGVGINNTSSNNDVVYGYVFPFLLELSDGKIMLLVAKWGIGKYAYATADAFNINGIYIKYGTIKDNQIEWTQKEEQIYKGLIYDPTAIETSDNELQVYFTSIAPVLYYQSDQTSKMYNGEYYYAVQSSLHNSSGVAMISMLKDKTSGKYVSTYTMPENDLLQYYKTNRNPYVAYRINQSYVATKTSPNIPYDFLNGKPAVNGLKLYGFKENGKVIQMGDGMASPLILNNKTMVMPLESTYIKEIKCNTNNCITSDLGISLAYSKPTPLSINGQIKNKYWIDLSNDFLKNAKNKKYASEKEVYLNNNGLDSTEVGPINRSIPVNTGSGPDIVQFPSGETLLSYHLWPSFQIKIGDNNAKFDNEKISNGNIEEIRCFVGGSLETNEYNQYLHQKLSRNTYCAAINIADFGTTNKGGYNFGGLYIDNSHRVLATLTYEDSDGSHLKISQYYLNHSIDSYSDGLSQENDDALFIGSDSSAQETVRSFHDNDYLYFVVDRLDTSISSADSNGLRIHSDGLMYNGKKYNYLWISFNNQKITRTNVGFEGNLEKIENLVSAKYIYSDNGYKVIVKIPKIDKNKNFYFIDSNTQKIELFPAITKGDKYDTLAGTREDNMNTWIHVYLKKPKENINIPSSSSDKLYTGNIQKHGITIPENTSIVSASSTLEAKNAGEYVIVLKLNDTSKYVWSDGTSENKKIKWIIKQATPQITLTAKISDYSGNAISANTANVNPVGGKVSYVYYIDSNCSTKTTLENGGAKSIGGAPINVGTYYVKATATASLNTKQVSSGCIKHVINKKVLPIPVKMGDRLYSGSVQSSGIVCPKGSITGGEASGVNVKTYTQTCTLSSNKNYIWSDGTTKVIKIDWKILSKEETYKVTFNDGNNELYSGYVSSGKTISRPSINPEKANYRFDNWYEDTSLTKIYDFSTPIKSNKIIYAKFIEQKKIILDINGGVDNGFKNYLYDKGATLNRYDIEKQLNEFIIPPDNKKIDYITIDGIKWEKNTYILNNNITIKIIWKDKGITYEILNGNNQSYIIDSNSNFIIKSSGDLEKLINITMDGIVIDTSNYDITSGSTILTLKPSYLNQLTVGKHEIEFIYSDGSANAELIIVKADESDSFYKSIKKDRNYKYIMILLGALFLIGIIIFIKRKKRV